MVQNTLKHPSTLNLSNVKVAFQHLNNTELRRAFILFTLMRSPFLVKWGSRLLSLALWIGLPITKIIKKTLFHQFCGGETIAECQGLMNRLQERNVGVILDYALEGKEQESDFDQTKHEVILTIAEAKKQNIGFIVFKMTGLARFALLEKVSQGQACSAQEEKEWQRVRERVRLTCLKAAKANVKILVDAEETWIQTAIDELSVAMMEEFNSRQPVVYLTLQMYRKDRYQYLQTLWQRAERLNFHLGVKLVRGAYMEKERERARALGYPSPIHDSKANTDEDFDRALRFCLDKIHQIGLFAGTHNESSTRLLADLIDGNGIERCDDKVVFSQLLGMSDHLTFNLAFHGYNALKLIPYGPVKETLPYLFRRAEENTSIQSQASREWTLLQEEHKRRQGKS